VNDRITAGAAAITASITGAAAIARAWPQAGKHRARWKLPALSDLLGPSTAYTTPDFADIPEYGVVTQAWRPCSGPCGQEMPSVLHADGSWQCGHCLTISGGAS
jgi:hypothetical protein